MIFSSFAFVIVFLPLAVAGYHLISRFRGGRLSILFLFLMSLVYYGYWKLDYLYIILASILVNYALGQFLLTADKGRKAAFLLGLACNLGSLAYFKYTDFAITTINGLAGTSIPLQHIVLPIGISFFTFQQIAYISDIYTGKSRPDGGFINYCLFICFFPQLVAGPIVHHQEMMPQFAAEQNRRLDWRNMYAGLILLGIGLAKKVLVADIVAPVATTAFDIMPSLTLPEAWIGSLAYSLQLYFDFSAYSDMALGCALFFNIHLPVNFNSPYKSLDIQDFWRRWHMTLSRWLRDYIYIPLGGNRKGYNRTLINVFITFLLGGLWHGAAWTFVLWGAMHGAALAVHRLWTRFGMLKLPRLLAWCLTFLFVNAAWVVFRATSMADAAKVYKGMLGLNGFEVTSLFKTEVYTPVLFTNTSYVTFRILVPVFLLLAWLAPNSLQLLGSGRPRVLRTLLALVLGMAVMFMLTAPNRITEFIYFQF